LRKQQKQKAMKRITFITAAFVLATGFTASAGTNNETGNPAKVSLESSFSKIVVQDGIELRLTESTEKAMQFSGKETDVKNVDWRIKNGTLYIKSKKGSLKTKVSIAVSVSQLNSLNVMGSSDVIINGELQSKNLDVFIDAQNNKAGVIALRTTGAITLEQADGTEIEVRESKGDVTIK
jgi:Putative auto-transporter adhesin, head GIN domain